MKQSYFSMHQRNVSPIHCSPHATILPPINPLRVPSNKSHRSVSINVIAKRKSTISEIGKSALNASEIGSRDEEDSTRGKLRKLLMKEQERNLRRALKSREKRIPTIIPDCLSYFSPFQGEYKIVNKKIIWKLPLQNILGPSPVQRKKHSVPPILKSPVEVQPKVNPKPKVLRIEYAHKSKTGQSDLFMHKTNQDTAIICSEFCRKKDSHFFAVADGHGTFGDKISSFVTNSLKCNLEKALLSLSESDAIKDAFTKTVKALAESKIDTRCSGTTCVSALIRRNKLFIGNVGDSRCILCTKSLNKQLTTDHKPSVKEEHERIVESGGIVAQAQGKGGLKMGPERVWMKSGLGPGLAMTRSIGDTIAKKIGVISEPDITECDLMEEEGKVLVLASDGIWDRMTNEEVAQMLLPVYNRGGTPNEVIDKLLEEAHNGWKSSGYSADDITAIIVFIKYETDE